MTLHLHVLPGGLAHISGKASEAGPWCQLLGCKKGGDLRTSGEEGLSNKTAQGQKDLAPCEQSLGFGRR